MSHVLPRPRPTRRSCIAVGAMGALSVLSGCGPVQVGQPTPQEPPAAGIDELYRRDLITSVEAAIAAVSALPAAQRGEGDLLSSLQLQRDALRTGAEAEQSTDAQQSADADASDDAGGADGDPRTAATALADLSVLSMQAARQTSSHLASPLIAVAARARWALIRLAAEAGLADVVPDIPAEEDMTPTRPVPATDPPDTRATSDLPALLGPLQRNELYAAYVREVLAARTADAERERLLALRDAHRERAERLAQLAAAVQGAEVVAAEPVAPLPSTIDDTASTENTLDLSLLEQHVQLTGALAADARPLSLRASLLLAESLAGTSSTMSPVPGLELPTSI